MEYKKYDSKDNYSFSFGGFPTYELLKNRPNEVEKILIKKNLEKNNEWQKIEEIAKTNKIIIEENDKQIEKIVSKDNIYIVGVFKKYENKIKSNIIDENTVVLDSPSDMGNMGTIMREMLGFGYKNLVLIKPCADYFNPKVIRASMGAIFSLNIKIYDNFAEFEKANKLPLYLFMLNGTENLSQITNIQSPNALVFGNEATGLPKEYTKKGVSIKIHHSNNIDSLNLSMSVGIALYEFTKNNFTK